MEQANNQRPDWANLAEVDLVYKSNVKASERPKKLTDEYSLFYLKFIENSKFSGAGSWTKFSTGSSWKSWSGFAFEAIVMKHIYGLKKSPRH